ncbi:hypothetical protein GCM10022224_103520 [Nonomuraea antimicrobica]|uniref:Uncharacterized protein n=1 Tax=Nonomuraea antimicrobica TaxID=561173 RepID=A0ABP7ELF1_9ACTN
MSREDESLPDLDDARQAAEESRRRAERDLRQARERARWMLDLAARLKRLREANGFEEMFEEAFGGGRD